MEEESQRERVGRRVKGRGVDEWERKPSLSRKEGSCV